MRQTLFYIPSLWIVIGWCVICLFATLLIWRKKGFGSELLNFLPFMLVTGAVVFYGLDFVMAKGPNPIDLNGDEISRGLPLRGYGFFLLLATVTGVGLAVYRARTLGIDPENIFSLAFWMFIVGIIGARMFYVVQKFDEFTINNPIDFLMAMGKMNQGGLVVYGSLIGALIAFVAFTKLKELPMFEIADIIAPSMIIGLSIGRIGCLMNGCCFGSVCEPDQIGIRFPEGSAESNSPPYYRQLETGEVLGIQGIIKTVDRVDEDGKTFTPLIEVASVTEGSVADLNGIAAGDRVSILIDPADYEKSRIDPRIKYVHLAKQGRIQQIEIPTEQLPDYSLRVHPTQIYSSVNAGLIFLFLWFFFPFRQRSGQVLALLLMLYPISRTILEFIRTDEYGFWGTPFTISQWISLMVFFIGLAFYTHIMLSNQPQISAGADNSQRMV